MTLEAVGNRPEAGGCNEPIKESSTENSFDKLLDVSALCLPFEFPLVLLFFKTVVDSTVGQSHGMIVVLIAKEIEFA